MNFFDSNRERIIFFRPADIIFWAKASSRLLIRISMAAPPAIAISWREIFAWRSGLPKIPVFAMITL